MGFVFSIIGLFVFSDEKRQKLQEKLRNPSADDRPEVYLQQHDSGNEDIDSLSDEDYATANEEEFDMTDIEDEAFAAHLQEILTEMRSDPRWLPPTSDHRAGPKRFKWHWERIVFNERIFEQRKDS